MIHTTNLTKRFNSHTVVDGVSLNISKGQIFGLLGPNAAGKTTLIRMMCGIIKSDTGKVSIDGMAIEKAKGRFGYVAQHFGQYEELTVWENLVFYARMYNVTDKKWLNTLINRYGLEAYREQFAGTLSGGYQRRLALACALVHDPIVLFLDEPTAGIDPVTRKLLWDDFYRLSSEGKTLFVTTHYMEEAQRCHQLAFISSGKFIAEGTPTTIKEALGDAWVYTVSIPYSPELREMLLNTGGIILINQFGNELRIVVTPTIDLIALQAKIDSLSVTTVSLERTNANLEDVFIALTQSPLDRS